MSAFGYRFTVKLTGRKRAFLTLSGEGRTPQDLRAGDAFVVPPAMKTAYTNCSSDLELLEVSLPGLVETTIHHAL